jgi:hypothetical protein
MAVILAVVTILGTFYAGATFELTQASMTEKIGVFLSSGQYTISRSTSNSYILALYVNGDIGNGGPEMCKIDLLCFNVSLHMTGSMRKYYNMSSQYSPSIGYSDVLMNSTYLPSGWSNPMVLAINDQQAFNVSMPIQVLDNSNPNILSYDIYGSVFLQCTDSSGANTTITQPVTQWIQVDSSP